ncbi:MAG: hypothetical protein ACHQD8_04985 [Chitinophagales bacterium]
MKRIVLYIIVACLFSGCGGRGLAIKENIFGNYFLVARDDVGQLSLAYHETGIESIYGIVIAQTVFAVGYNEHYIIVKQHPDGDKQITNYYILPIKKGMDWGTKNGLIGPLTLEQFNEKRIALNIPDGLNFTIEKANLK